MDTIDEYQEIDDRLDGQRDIIRQSLNGRPRDDCDDAGTIEC
jgi:hypothetical protein